MSAGDGSAFGPTYPADVRDGAGIRFGKAYLTIRGHLDYRSLQDLSSLPDNRLIAAQDADTGAIQEVPFTVLSGITLIGSSALFGNLSGMLGRPYGIALYDLAKPVNPIGDAIDAKVATATYNADLSPINAALALNADVSDFGDPCDFQAKVQSALDAAQQAEQNAHAAVSAAASVPPEQAVTSAGISVGNDPATRRGFVNGGLPDFFTLPDEVKDTSLLGSIVKTFAIINKITPPTPVAASATQDDTENVYRFVMNNTDRPDLDFRNYEYRMDGWDASISSFQAGRATNTWVIMAHPMLKSIRNLRMTTRAPRLRNTAMFDLRNTVPSGIRYTIGWDAKAGDDRVQLRAAPIGLKKGYYAFLKAENYLYGASGVKIGQVLPIAAIEGSWVIFNDVLMFDYRVDHVPVIDVLGGNTALSGYTGSQSGERFSATGTPRLPLIDDFTLENVVYNGPGKAYLLKPGETGYVEGRANAGTDTGFRFFACPRLRVIGCRAHDASLDGFNFNTCGRVTLLDHGTEGSGRYGTLLGLSYKASITGFRAKGDYVGIEAGSGNYGVTDEVSYVDGKASEIPGVAFNIKEGVRVGKYTALSGSGNGGTEFEAVGNAHTPTIFRSRAGTTLMTRIEASDAAKGIDLEPYAGAFPDGARIEISHALIKRMNDYSCSINLSDSQNPTVRGYITDLTSIDQNNSMNDASTLPSAVLHIRLVQGTLDEFDIARITAINNQAHFISIVKNAGGALRSLRFGDGLSDTKHPRALAPAITSQVVTFDVATGVVRMPSGVAAPPAGTTFTFSLGPGAVMPAGVRARKNYTVSETDLGADYFHFSDISQRGAWVAFTDPGSGTIFIIGTAPRKVVKFNNTGAVPRESHALALSPLVALVQGEPMGIALPFDCFLVGAMVQVQRPITTGSALSIGLTYDGAAAMFATKLSLPLYALSAQGGVIAPAFNRDMKKGKVVVATIDSTVGSGGANMVVKLLVARTGP